MNYFVQRDQMGNITGLATCLQVDLDGKTPLKGWSGEILPDTDPALAPLLSPTIPDSPVVTLAQLTAALKALNLQPSQVTSALEAVSNT